MDPRPAAAALLLASACAAPDAAFRPDRAPVPVVRQAIDAGQADAIFGRAVQLLEQHGYEFVTCDLARGALRTERVEKDAPCIATSCLARQVVTVKLGWRSVRLAVVREVFDGSYRSWMPADDPASLEGVAREEERLLRELLAADLEGARSAGPGEPSGPCQQAARCGPGQCSVMLNLVGK